MTMTTKGVPYPEPTYPNNVPGDIKAVANWVNAHPGITTMTTVERNALTGMALWPGRTIYNSTEKRHEVNPTGTAGASKWTPMPRLPEVWSLQGPGTGRWTRPDGATRIRMILVGAGGKGSTNGSTNIAVGGGGGGVIDVILPASQVWYGEIAVSVGGPTTGAGGNTEARVEDPDNFLPEYTAFGGAQGNSPGLGAGGGFTAFGLIQSDQPAWFGYRGNQAPTADVQYPPIARGPGAGVTVRNGALDGYTQRGGGITRGAGDPTLGFMGAGGAVAGTPGHFPGGGGAGASAAAPGSPGAGAPGVAVIIAYFDE